MKPSGRAAGCIKMKKMQYPNKQKTQKDTLPISEMKDTSLLN